MACANIESKNLPGIAAWVCMLMFSLWKWVCERTCVHVCLMNYSIEGEIWSPAVVWRIYATFMSYCKQCSQHLSCIYDWEALMGTLILYLKALTSCTCAFYHKTDVMCSCVYCKFEIIFWAQTCHAHHDIHAGAGGATQHAPVPHQLWDTSQFLITNQCLRIPWTSPAGAVFVCCIIKKLVSPLMLCLNTVSVYCIGLKEWTRISFLQWYYFFS